MTVRALSDLLGRFSNARHGNEAQDLRDLAQSTFPPQFSGARIHKNGTAQNNITQGATVTVTFSTASFDSDSYFDNPNDALVAPTDALYLVTASLAFVGSVDAFDLFGVIRVGALNYQSIGRITNGSSTTLGWEAQYLSGSAIVQLNANDAVTLGAFSQTQAGSDTVDIRGDAFATSLAIVRLGQAPA